MTAPSPSTRSLQNSLFYKCFSMPDYTSVVTFLKSSNIQFHIFKDQKWQVFQNPSQLSSHWHILRRNSRWPEASTLSLPISIKTIQDKRLLTWLFKTILVMPPLLKSLSLLGVLFQKLRYVKCRQAHLSNSCIYITSKPKLWMQTSNLLQKVPILQNTIGKG